MLAAIGAHSTINAVRSRRTNAADVNHVGDRSGFATRFPALAPALVVAILVCTQTGLVEATRPATSWGDAVTVSRVAFTGWEGRQTADEVVALTNELVEMGDGIVLTDWTADWSELAGQLWMATFPIATNGRISSAEGVLYESSASLPFLLTAQQFLSSEAIGSMRRVTEAFDPAKGARLAADLGVRFLVLRNRDATAAVIAAGLARSHRRVSGFDIVELTPAPFVEVLNRFPRVVRNAPQTQEDGWVDVAMASWLEPDRVANTSEFFAMGGPANWPRVTALLPPGRPLNRLFGADITWTNPTSPSGTVTAKGTSAVNPTSNATITATSSATITELSRARSTKVSFRTNRVGSAVRIRMPWSPRWKVQGGQGPWRAGPNHMVVLPTTERVVLALVTPWWEHVVRIISLLTIATALVWLIRRARNR
jgi:hypothetical protein